MKIFTPVFILFICSIFSFHTLSAQTIPNSAMPEAGDVIVSIVGDTTGISEGPAGSNVSWDFTALKPMDGAVESMSSFVAPSETPHAGAFPMANLALISNTGSGDVYSYYTRNGNKLDYIGGESFGIFTHFEQDPMLVLQTGLSSGENAFDTFAGFTDNMGNKSYAYGTQNMTVDASGSLKMPNETFNNAVRMVNQTERTDSSVIGATVILVRLETTTFSWFISGQPEPVISISYTEGESTSIVSGGAPMVFPIAEIKSVVYNPDAEDSTTTATHDLDQSIPAMHIQNLYPNPSSGSSHLIVEMKEASEVELRIVDLYGREVNRIAWSAQQGLNEFSIDLSAYPSGLYIVNLSNGQEMISQKIKKQ